VICMVLRWFIQCWFDAELVLFLAMKKREAYTTRTSWTVSMTLVSIGSESDRWADKIWYLCRMTRDGLRTYLFLLLFFSVLNPLSHLSRQKIKFEFTSEAHEDMVAGTTKTSNEVLAARHLHSFTFHFHRTTSSFLEEYVLL
jgi:hypothetical protein